MALGCKDKSHNILRLCCFLTVGPNVKAAYIIVASSNFLPTEVYLWHFSVVGNQNGVLEAGTFSAPYVSSIFQILFFSFWNYREFGHKRKNSGLKSGIRILSFGIFLFSGLQAPEKQLKSSQSSREDNAHYCFVVLPSIFHINDILEFD